MYDSSKKNCIKIKSKQGLIAEITALGRTKSDLIEQAVVGADSILSL